MVSRLILLFVNLGLVLAVSEPCMGQEPNAVGAPLKVVAVCMNAKLDKAANLETFTSYIIEAAEQGAHLVVFPEMALQQNPGWGANSYQPTADELNYVQSTAETIPGPSTDRVVELARTYRVCVLFGMTERGPDGDFYNASVLVAPAGVLGSYRKTRLWDSSTGGNEHRFWQSGGGDRVVQSPLGKVGLMICIEMFHNFGPDLATAGADFIAVVSAWPASSGGLYESSTKSNAQQANRWLVVANQTGGVGHSTDYGHSRIIDPNGVILADTGTGEGMVIAETDLLIPRPVVDFNCDGKVDGADILVLAAHWGQEEPACDIAPAPFGDGIIDVQDLIVLADYIGKDLVDGTLIAHWALDETEGDIAYDSADENDGTVLGGAAWRPEEGFIGGAMEFDGVDDCIETPRIAGAGGSLSVLAWIKGGGPNQAIVSASEGSNWLLGSVAGRDGIGGKLATGFGSEVLISSVVIADGQWHRIAFVWDGTSRLLYVDGVLVAEDQPGDLQENRGKLYIGCGSDQASGSFFSGLIDDVRIYNRTVRP